MARTFRRGLPGLAVLAFGLAVSGCAMRLSDFEQSGDTTPVPVAAKLQAGDKISVTVYGEPALSGDYQVDQRGFVSLPQAGAVMAAGQTQTELAQALANRLRSQYMKDPKVSVFVPGAKQF